MRPVGVPHVSLLLRDVGVSTERNRTAAASLPKRHGRGYDYCSSRVNRVLKGLTLLRAYPSPLRGILDQLLMFRQLFLIREQFPVVFRGTVDLASVSIAADADIEGA